MKFSTVLFVSAYIFALLQAIAATTCASKKTVTTTITTTPTVLIKTTKTVTTTTVATLKIKTLSTTLTTGGCKKPDYGYGIRTPTRPPPSKPSSTKSVGKLGTPGKVIPPPGGKYKVGYKVNTIHRYSTSIRVFKQFSTRTIHHVAKVVHSAKIVKAHGGAKATVAKVKGYGVKAHGGAKATVAKAKYGVKLPYGKAGPPKAAKATAAKAKATVAKAKYGVKLPYGKAGPKAAKATAAKAKATAAKAKVAKATVAKAKGYGVRPPGYGKAAVKSKK